MAGIALERSGVLLTVRLHKARGNAIDEPLLDELRSLFVELEADDTLRGVLLASSHPTLFCPGLDLVGLAAYDRPSMERFMAKFAAVVWALYGFQKPVVAALSGHAVAGGCVLALTADHRVLRRGGVQIGLNEVRIGVPLPWTVSVLLRSSVPSASLPQVALIGQNFTDDDALRVGLVDSLAPPTDFEQICLSRLEEFAERDPHSVGTTKAFLRLDALAEMKAREKEFSEPFLNAWFSAATRERMQKIIAGLTSRRS